MDILSALQLKVGDKVRYPEDAPYSEGVGKIDYVTHNKHHSFNGTEYIWVSVKQQHGHSTIWPSNRLENQQ